MKKISTIIVIIWADSGDLEIFRTLGSLFKKYDAEKLGVSRFTLDRKNLDSGGYGNEKCEIFKRPVQ